MSVLDVMLKTIAAIGWALCAFLLCWAFHLLGA